MEHNQLIEELMKDESFVEFIKKQKEIKMKLMDDELQSTIIDGEVIQPEPHEEVKL